MEKVLNDGPHVAALGIEDVGGGRQFGGLNDADVPTADALRRRFEHEQFFLEEGDQVEIGLGEGQRNEGEIEAAVEETVDHFLGGGDGNFDGCLREFLAEQAERGAETVYKSGGAGGEVKGTVVGEGIVGKFLRSEEHTSELQSLRHLVC